MANILVVDDELGIRDLLQEILNDEGHTVEVAENAAQARAARSRDRPDLVLMDIQLPDINGVEAFRRIRAHAATAAVPVVAFTASVTPTDRHRITDAGFDGFIGKPVNLKEFLETVRTTLAGKVPCAKRRTRYWSLTTPRPTSSCWSMC